MAKNRNTNSTQDISFKERSPLKKNPNFFGWCDEQVKHHQFSLRILRGQCQSRCCMLVIIDQVVALNTNSPAGNLQELWQLVALEFALALLTD
jgi:ATP-binding cassette subfamily B protein